MKLFRITALLIPLLALFGCGDKTQYYRCTGTVTDTPSGSLAMGVEPDVSKDTISVSVNSKTIVINGSEISQVALPVVATPEKVGAVHVLSNVHDAPLKLCSVENHIIKFNNYSCDDKNIQFPNTFYRYDGELNGISNTLIIDIFKSPPDPVAERIFHAAYHCTVVRPTL